MSLERDLTPPIEPGEIETVCFDFGPILAANVAIASVSVVACSVHAGTDATPAARLIGGNALIASPATGVASAAVLQMVGMMVAGVSYTLRCVVSTSDGQTLALSTHLPCQAVA